MKNSTNLLWGLTVASSISSYALAGTETSNYQVDWNPPKVTLENIRYHIDKTGEKVCLYDHRGKKIASGGHKGSLELNMEVLFYDKDGFKKITGYTDGGPIFESDGKAKVTTYGRDKKETGKEENTFTIGKYLPDLDLYFEYPIGFIITDLNGNTTTKTFTLDSLLKNGKPMETRPELNCPDAITLSMPLSKNSQ